MTLIKYNPLNDFIPTTFGDVVERMLHDVPARENVFTPSVDILKNEKEIELHVIAPGLTRENFNIDLNEDRLVISGERTMQEAHKELYKSVESRFGKFRRVFKLNKDINAEKISARYADGILYVTLPLQEKKDNKKTIKIS